MTSTPAKPAPGPAAPVLRPAINADNAYFWDGVAAGELRIQRCSRCATLRHPSGPGCALCGSLDWDYVVASGQGRVHSYAVVHHPLLPPFESPYTVLVVDLQEGVRFVSQLIGEIGTSVGIGSLVHVEFVTVATELTLPFFRPVAS